ncbi:MAG: transposase [Methylocystaceae bacterium]
MSNPFNIYFAVKNMITKKTNCPHCQHQLEVFNISSPQYLTCKKCGKTMKVVSGKAYQQQYKNKKVQE